MDQRVLNHTADGISAAAILGTIFGILPGIAAIAGIIWYGIQIYESKTVQRWVRARRIKAIRARRAEANDGQPS